MTDTITPNKNICKIFSDVKYFVTGAISEQIRKILDDGGAEKTNFFSDMVTHCIVGQQPRENDISDAKDLYEVPAVTPYWVLISAFCNKILPTRGFIYDSKQIFSNVIITASQVSNADFKALWAMITFYGGVFKITLDKSCTHLISGKPFGKKYEAALNISHIKIVTPDWVVESIKANSRIEEDFYHPKNLIFPKTRENSPADTTTDLSTAQILGFAEDVNPSPAVIDAASSVTSTQALLEKLKQRMPWNRPSPTVSSSNTMSSSPFCGLSPNTSTSQLQSQIPQTSQVSMLSNQAVHLQTSPPPQQIERISVDQHGRVSQQNSLWRSATIQTIRPQYTLIQRDGSVVQPSQTASWAQYHLQQRLQQQNQGQQTQAVQQHQQNLSAQQSIAHQSPQMQQAVILQNSQIQNQSPGSANIQASNQTQRQITWTQQATPKQVIQLDPQTHAQLSQMDPQQRTLFLQKIQRQKQIILQQRQLQLQHQQRPMAQSGKPNSHQQSSSASGQQQSQSQQQNLQQQTSSTPLRQQQIIIRGIMPPGLTAQQQAAWLHQQQFIRQQQILVPQQTNQIRSSVNVSQTRISQQQTATSTWIPQSDNSQQQQQQQQQLQLQRQQQFRIQQLQIQKQQQIVVQRAVSSIPQQFHQTSQQNLSTQNISQGMHPEDSSAANQTVGTVGGGLLVNNRTKTALANMLSSRLQTGLLSPQSQNLNQTDNSASGQLRLMSAQQRATQPPPPPPSPSSVQLPEAQPALYNQQRRTLGNISNSGLGVKSNLAGRDVQATGTSVLVSKTPGRTVLTASNSSTGPASPQKSQFFTHNPNLRIPTDKYFLGCIFFIVEYDQIASDNLAVWEEIIKDHGGEIESSYTPRVTHVLCETQKHGIVQQALRDGKRCITAFWLNDIVSKGSLNIPWLALHFPVPFGREKPLSKYQVTLTGFEDKTERQRVATMIQVAGGQYRNYLSPLTHIIICRKSDGAKYKKAKETNKITVNVQWLNEVLFGHYTCIQQPDIQKYQQYNCSTCFRVDYSLIPHLMGAWKIPINVTSELYATVKNSLSPPRKIKKLKLEPTLEQKMEFENKILESIQVTNIENLTFEHRPHILITGDKNLEITKKAKEIGCMLAKNNKITHLVVCGKPRRTLKMLKSLIVAKHIVTDTWVEDCYNQKKLLNESSYSILQADFEDFKCNISKVLSSSERNNLFKDKIFYMTPNVEPSKKALSELILLCGGQVEKQRRSIKTIQELNKATQTYIVISCYNDLALISDIFRAKLGAYEMPIFMRIYEIA